MSVDATLVDKLADAVAELSKTTIALAEPERAGELIVDTFRVRAAAADPVSTGVDVPAPSLTRCADAVELTAMDAVAVASTVEPDKPKVFWPYNASPYAER